MVVVLNLESNNVSAVLKRVQEITGNVKVSSDEADLKLATKIIIPGVGNFEPAIKYITARNLKNTLYEQIVEKKIPVLGICLGMQLLGTSSEEAVNAEGLGIIQGTTLKLPYKPELPNYKIPHIGWNSINIVKDNPLFKGIADNTRCYFSHSYHFVPAVEDIVCGTTEYSTSIASVINKGHIFGVQFHPEKSREAGTILFKNFIEY